MNLKYHFYFNLSLGLQKKRNISNSMYLALLFTLTAYVIGSISKEITPLFTRFVFIVMQIYPACL